MSGTGIGKPLSYNEDENCVPEKYSKITDFEVMTQNSKPHQRTVLQDLSLNTILQPSLHKSGGGGSSPAASTTPVVDSKPDHEANVQFAREFIVELVETVPKKSEKAALAKRIDKEDIVSLKSVSPSVSSFQSVSSVTENSSLPDLLQPESVYKKQTDTDTDTTEYESAAETDPLDAASPIGSLIAEDLLSSFQEALDKKYPPTPKELVSPGDLPKSSVESIVQETETVQDSATSVPERNKASECKTDNSVSQGSDPSPLSDAYEDAGDIVIKTEVEEIEVNPLDISGLCLCVNNLCLDSPKRPGESELTGDDSSFEHKEAADVSCSSSDIPVPVNEDSIKLTEVGSQAPDQFDTVLNSSDGDIHEVEGNKKNRADVVLDSGVVGVVDFENFETSIFDKAVNNSDSSLASDSVIPLNDTNSVQCVKTEEEGKPEVQVFKTGEGSVTDIHEATGDCTQTDSVDSGQVIPVVIQTGKEFSPNKSFSLEDKEHIALKENSAIDTEFGKLQPLLENNFSDTSKIGKEVPAARDILSSAITIVREELVSKDSLTYATEIEKPIAKENCLVLTELEKEVSSENLSLAALGKEVDLKGDFSDKAGPGKEECLLEENVSNSNDVQEKEPVINKLTGNVKEEPCPSLRSEIFEVCESVKDIQKEGISEITQFNTKLSTETDTGSELSFSDNKPVKEIPSNQSATDSIEEKLPRTSLLSRLCSTAFDIIKDPVSKVTDISITDKTKEPDVYIPYKDKSFEDPKVDTALCSISAEVGAGDWVTLPVEKEIAVVKEAPAILSELFEICNRQQKDLELGDEKNFVDGREFFTSPSTTSNLNKTSVLDISCKSHDIDFEQNVDQPSVDSFAEFDQSITEEAEKILQDIINSSSELHETSERRLSSGSTHQTGSLNSSRVMAGVTNSSVAVDENGISPFHSQSALRRSPPLSGKLSPRSSSQGPSPSESPRQKSRLSSVTPVKDGSLPHDHGSGDGSPRSRSGKNSPDRRVSSNKMPSVENSPKHSINSEINQSEAGPEIADDAHLQSGDAIRGSWSLTDIGRRLVNVVSSCKPPCASRLRTPAIPFNTSEFVFKDPATFDFLNSVGNSHTGSDLRKESLYVKFDPLVGSISRTTDKSVPLPPGVDANSFSCFMNISPSKEQQLSGNTTPERNPAISVIEKLISLSPSPLRPRPKSPVVQPVVSPVKEVVCLPVRQEQPVNPEMPVINDAVIEELYLLRELLSRQDEKHREDVKRHREQVTSLEQELMMARKQLDSSQALVKESEERETKLNKKVAEKAQGQKQMSIIMEEYEKTISRLVAEKEQERQAHELDRSTLLKDRDAAMGHLANIEIAFSDLHKKYERSKTVIEGFKKNEEVLRTSLAEYEATIRKQEQKYDVLKNHAMAQLENANQELDSLRRSQQAEAAKLKAMLKKAEIKTSSLEEMLEQKVKENQELASICDELISKVGGSE